jgi:hypothetical protein
MLMIEILVKKKKNVNDRNVIVSHSSLSVPLKSDQMIIIHLVHFT